MTASVGRNRADDEMVRKFQARPSMQIIFKVAAEVTRVPLDVLMSTQRDRPTVHARHAAIWVAVRRCGYVQSAVAHFSKQDHSTISYALQCVDARSDMPEYISLLKRITVVSHERQAEIVRSRSADADYADRVGPGVREVLRGPLIRNRKPETASNTQPDTHKARVSMTVDPDALSPVQIAIRNYRSKGFTIPSIARFVGVPPARVAEECGVSWKE